MKLDQELIEEELVRLKMLSVATPVISTNMFAMIKKLLQNGIITEKDIPMIVMDAVDKMFQITSDDENPMHLEDAVRYYRQSMAALCAIDSEEIDDIIAEYQVPTTPEELEMQEEMQSLMNSEAPFYKHGWFRLKDIDFFKKYFVDIIDDVES